MRMIRMIVVMVVVIVCMAVIMIGVAARMRPMIMNVIQYMLVLVSHALSMSMYQHR